MFLLLGPEGAWARRHWLSSDAILRVSSRIITYRGRTQRAVGQFTDAGHFNLV